MRRRTLTLVILVLSLAFTVASIVGFAMLTGGGPGPAPAPNDDGTCPEGYLAVLSDLREFAGDPAASTGVRCWPEPGP